MKQPTFCQRLDEVAFRRGTHPALQVDGNAVCTYEELIDRSRWIARSIEHHVGRRTSVIAIGLPKSIDYVASLIGIWRAGCIALPLPPELPSQRRQEMLRRSNAALVITGGDCDAIGMQRPDEGCETATMVFQPAAVYPGLAYILFTSGSTGRPKGVVVSHRGLMPMLDAQIDAFDLDSTTRSLFYLSTAFDASLSDIGTALICGGTLLVESELLSLSVSDLFARIADRDVTYADLPPAVMTHAAKQRIEAPASLRTVVVGGELCTVEAIRWWTSRLRLINVYGPTEATVCTSAHVWSDADQDPTSIGRPFPSAVYRIEPSDASDPSVGELWIGGDCLADGYLDDDGLQATKFVTRDERWYRTGDRVARDHSGQYHFLGRLDRQFKLLGRLVEPAEIEHSLLKLAEVSAAVVVPIFDEAGDDRGPSRIHSIGCVLELADGCHLDVATVPSQLVGRLPEWMIPQHVRTVARIPRTPSGKVDYAAVASMFARGSFVDQPPPDSPHAAALRRIWMAALHTEAIDWDDDFFLAGGDSIAALQLLAQAAVAGVPITLSTLNQRRTLRQCLLAAGELAEGMTTSELETRLDPVLEGLVLERVSPAAPTRERHFLVTGATGFLGTWFLEQLLSQSAVKVECLVRADDPLHALARIESARQSYLGRSAMTSGQSNVSALCGDIREPYWGLDQQQWDRLGEEVTDVVHLAAEVHLLESFDALRAANLDSVTAALRLCHHRRIKSLHYASTLSVFVATDRLDERFYEEDQLVAAANVFGGYGQTKWLAERLLWRSRRSCSMSVYRFGLLTGDSRLGIHPASDQLARFTRGLATLGVYPEGCGRLRFDVTPVDYASRVLCQLTQADLTGTFHVCGRRDVTFAEWIGAMEATGIQLRRVSPDEFQTVVRQRIDAGDRGDAATACLSLCCRLETLGTARTHRELDLFLATGVEFDAARTEQALSGSETEWFKVDQAGLMRIVESMLAPGTVETMEQATA